MIFSGIPPKSPAIEFLNENLQGFGIFFLEKFPCKKQVVDPVVISLEVFFGIIPGGNSWRIFWWIRKVISSRIFSGGNYLKGIHRGVFGEKKISGVILVRAPGEILGDILARIYIDFFSGLIKLNIFFWKLLQIFIKILFKKCLQRFLYEFHKIYIYLMVMTFLGTVLGVLDEHVSNFALFGNSPKVFLNNSCWNFFRHFFRFLHFHPFKCFFRNWLRIFTKKKLPGFHFWLVYLANVVLPPSRSFYYSYFLNLFSIYFSRDSSKVFKKFLYKKKL